jgi:predicted RNA-binding Zn-ribbon protein involved in translation (DUF1610 family)
MNKKISDVLGKCKSCGGHFAFDKIDEDGICGRCNSHKVNHNQWKRRHLDRYNELTPSDVKSLGDLGQHAYADILKYGTIGQAAKKLGVNRGLLHRAINGKDSKKLRKFYNLPLAKVEVDPCPLCGEVHTQKTCQHTRSKDPRYRLALEFETREEQLDARDLIEELDITRKEQSAYLISILRSYLDGMTDEFPQT